MIRGCLDHSQAAVDLLKEAGERISHRILIEREIRPNHRSENERRILLHRVLVQPQHAAQKLSGQSLEHEAPERLALRKTVPRDAVLVSQVRENQQGQLVHAL